MRSSKIVCQGLKIKPVGVEWHTDTTCMLCGKPILKGDLAIYDPMRDKSGFMDQSDLVGYHKVACGWCCAMLDPKPRLMNLMSTVTSTKGSYHIKTDVSRQWFFENPPEPPYVAFVHNQQTQHGIWKMETCYSKDVISLLMGKTFLTIRRKELFKATKLCKRAGEIITEFVDNKKTYAHPYIKLDRNLKELAHGSFLPIVSEVEAQDEEFGEIIDFLRILSLGETWALATTAKSKPVKAVKPEKLSVV